MIRFVLNNLDRQPSLDLPSFYPASALISLPDSTHLESYNSLIHEYVHLLQVFGTPFGRFLTMGVDFRASLITEGLKSLVKLESPIMLNLRDWRDIVDGDIDAPDNRTPSVILLNRTIGFADRVERALGTFLGAPTATRPLDPHRQGHTIMGSAFTSVAPPKSDSSPTVDFRGRKIKIAGMSLLESFSYYWTFLFKRFLIGNKDIDFSAMLFDLSEIWKNHEVFSIYAFPLALAWQYFGEDGLRWFPMIVDLSLRGRLPEWPEIFEPDSVIFSPEEGIKPTLSSSQDAWEDVHPGWRYFKILEFIKNERPDLVKIPFFGRRLLSHYPPEMDVMLFPEILCDALGWPHTSSLAEKSIEHIDKDEQLSSNFFHKIYRNIDRQYLGLPGLLAFPLLFMHLFEDVGLGLSPPPFISVGGKHLHTNEHIPILAGVQLRVSFADSILPPLGISWSSIHRDQPFCPMVSGPLQGLCEYKFRIRDCAHGFPNVGCTLRKLLREEFNIDIENIEWLR